MSLLSTRAADFAALITDTQRGKWALASPVKVRRADAGLQPPHRSTHAGIRDGLRLHGWLVFDARGWLVAVLT